MLIGIGQASIQDPAAPLAHASMPGASTRLAYAYLVQGISLTPEEDAVMDALEQAQPVQQILTARTEYDVYSLDVLSLDGVDLGSVWQIADQQQQHACRVRVAQHGEEGRSRAASLVIACICIRN